MTTKTETKPAAKAKTVLKTMVTPAELLDKYLAAEASAARASTRKGKTRDDVLAHPEVDNGTIITSNEGISRKAVDLKETTNQHAKVVAAMAADFGVTEAQLKAYYRKTAGSKHTRELKKV